MRNSQDQHKTEIKKLILNSLRDNEIEVISYTDNQHQIFWEEEGKEFSLNGQMFDVVKSKTVNGKVFLYCINDIKEKLLIDKYNLITKHQSSSDKKGKNNIDDSFNYVFNDTRPFKPFYDLNSKGFFPYFISGVQSVSPEKITPPPKA